MIVRAPSQRHGFEDIDMETTVTEILENSESDETAQSVDGAVEHFSSKYNNTVTTTTNFLQDDSLRFILVPLAVLLGIIALSALVFLMARQRRINRPSIHFENYTSQRSDNYKKLIDGEECEEIDDDPTECLLNGKLQINNRYENYQAAQMIKTSKARGELYT